MKKTNTLTQSVTRALDILSCFTDEQPEVRVVDVANKLNLTQSNVSRLLVTMESLHYVEKDELSGFYRLGPQIISLGGIALNNYDIRKQALPELYALENKLGLGANLAVFSRNRMFYLAHVDSHKSPRMYTMNGRSLPLHCTGIGKVLLAHLDPQHRDEFVQVERLHQYTAHTICDAALLQDELELIRQQGYAMEIEELALGRACIAAPVRDRKGQVIAGMSISGSLSDLNIKARESELSSIIIEVADRVSVKMGHISGVASTIHKESVRG